MSQDLTSDRSAARGPFPGVAALVGLAAAAAAASALGHSPLEGPRIDLVRHFPAHCLLALGSAAAGLLLLRRPMLAAAAALSCLLPLSDLLPLWLPPTAATASAGPTDAGPADAGPTDAGPADAGPADAGPADLRVVTCNLLLTNRDLSGLVAWLEPLAPDLLALSEFTPAHEQALAPLLARYPHRVARADPGHFGIALLSRWPLHAGEVLPLGCDWAPAIRAVATTPLGEVGLLCVHPPQPASAAGGRARDLALMQLPAALAPLPARRIVLGDCNATRWSRPFARAIERAGLRDSSDGHGYQGSWPARLPSWLRIPIDHVLVSASLEATSRGLGPAFGSDHLPVWAEVSPRR